MCSPSTLRHEIWDCCCIQVQAPGRGAASRDRAGPKGERVRFNGYDTGEFFDELFEAPACPRPGGRLLASRIESLPEGELLRRQQAAERALLHMGITFNVYGSNAGTERIFPFDVLPRIVESKEWETLERGLTQRIHALNIFINDVYHD